MSTRTAQCLVPGPYFAAAAPAPAPRPSRPETSGETTTRPRRTSAQITPFPARRGGGPLPELLSTGLSDVGRLRPSNEDAFGIDDGRRLYVVADGVGGAGHGDVASRLAVDEILARPARAAGGNTPELVSALRRAHARLARAAAGDRNLRGMSTTVVAMGFDGANSAVLTHLGDSRAYRLRDGVLQRLTSDHTLASELRLAGVDPSDAAGLWRSWSVNMLTRCLNTEQPPVIDATRVDVRPGDVFLLCTDGLTKMLGDEEIRDNLLGRGWRSRAWRLLARRGWGSLAQRSRRLLSRALDKGGSDNVTLVLVEVAEVGRRSPG